MHGEISHLYSSVILMYRVTVFISIPLEMGKYLPEPACLLAE